MGLDSEDTEFKLSRGFSDELFGAINDVTDLHFLAEPVNST